MITHLIVCIYQNYFNSCMKLKVLKIGNNIFVRDVGEFPHYYLESENIQIVNSGRSL